MHIHVDYHDFLRNIDIRLDHRPVHSLGHRAKLGEGYGINNLHGLIVAQTVGALAGYVFGGGLFIWGEGVEVCLTVSGASPLVKYISLICCFLQPLRQLSPNRYC